jgi:TRAP-type C4-dicarboxylate transport system permease small subunit
MDPKIMRNILKLVDNIIKGATGFSIFLIMLITCIQVFYRFALNDAQPWPEEASRFLMIWALFLGGAYAFLDREHASITYLSSRLPRKPAVVIDVIIQLLIIVFLLAIIYGGWQQMTLLGSYSTGALGISRAIPYAALPVSGLLYIAVAVRLIINNFGGRQA